MTAELVLIALLSAAEFTSVCVCVCVCLNAADHPPVTRGGSQIPVSRALLASWPTVS